MTFTLLLPFNLVSLASEQVYESQGKFVARAFQGTTPPPQTLWLSKAMRDAMTEQYQYSPNVLRLPYWSSGNRTVWIIEEIGKTKPITCGVVVADDAIVEVKVLTFRESRGWEVRYPFFTDQFRAVKLDKKNKLNRKINGITGATLSVRALKKVAAVAIQLHRWTRNKPDAISSIR